MSQRSISHLLGFTPGSWDPADPCLHTLNQEQSHQSLTWLQLISAGQRGARGLAHQEFQLATLHMTLQRPWQSKVTPEIPSAPRPHVLELVGSRNPRGWVRAMQRQARLRTVGCTGTHTGKCNTCKPFDSPGWKVDIRNSCVSRPGPTHHCGASAEEPSGTGNATQISNGFQ